MRIDRDGLVVDLHAKADQHDVENVHQQEKEDSGAGHSMQDPGVLPEIAPVDRPGAKADVARDVNHQRQAADICQHRENVKRPDDDVGHPERVSQRARYSPVPELRRRRRW